MNGLSCPSFKALVRIQPSRHRIDIPSLRGVDVQRPFGSQRAWKTVEEFTEFEQRAAYFDGDLVIATKKGANILEQGSQVQLMPEFQAILNFPPAPKKDVLGKLEPKKGTESEFRGQGLFFGKAKCSICHPASYYTDDLKAERFFEPKDVNGRHAAAVGPIKTSPCEALLSRRRIFTTVDCRHSMIPSSSSITFCN